MKKIISIIALALVGLHVQAQSLWDKSAPDDRLTFGLRAGVNFATTDADEANSTVTHYHIGLAVDYNIIKSFSISSGLYIVEKGFKGNYIHRHQVEPDCHLSADTAYGFLAHRSPIRRAIPHKRRSLFCLWHWR